MPKQSSAVALPVIPVMPDSLKAIAKTLAEIREIAYLDHGAFTKKYVSVEGQAAINSWWQIRSKCSAAKERAEKKVKRHRLTVEDGLPAEFVALDTLHEEAQKACTAWTEVSDRLRTVWSEPDNYRVPFGMSTVRRLSEVAWHRISADRNLVSSIKFDTEKRLEPKEREGTIVRRLRQDAFAAYSKQQAKVGNAAFNREMKRLHGYEAERQAKAAERKGKQAREADLRVLCKRLEQELGVYLLEMGVSDG